MQQVNIVVCRRIIPKMLRKVRDDFLSRLCYCMEVNGGFFQQNFETLFDLKKGRKLSKSWNPLPNLELFQPLSHLKIVAINLIFVKTFILTRLSGMQIFAGTPSSIFQLYNDRNTHVLCYFDRSWKKLIL